MSNRWSQDEDVFLLRYHSAINPDFLGEHDLDRPWGAGSRRLQKLTKSGARVHCARMMYARAEFEFAAGRMGKWEHDRELEMWGQEEADAIAEMRPRGSVLMSDGRVVEI